MTHTARAAAAGGAAAAVEALGASVASVAAEGAADKVAAVLAARLQHEALFVRVANLHASTGCPWPGLLWGLIHAAIINATVNGSGSLLSSFSMSTLNKPSYFMASFGC